MLEGRVVEAATASPVGSATVVLRGTRVGTVANDDGRFVLGGLPAGSARIVVGRLGYRTDTLTVTIRSGDTTRLTVRLQPATAALQTVKVAAAATERDQFRLSGSPSVVSVRGETLKRVPVIGEPDVLRVVQLLPGVVATNDFTAGYNVRGGESDQNLVLLDGYPIYNPFHLGGLFGTFIDETVAEFELLPGGIPARYGSRLSSVLSVVPKAEARSGVHGAASVSVLASTLSLGGTVRGTTSWNVAARRTYADRFVSLLSDRQLPYYFTDMQAHVRHQLRGGGTLSATAYRGSDVLDASLEAFGDSSQAGGGRILFDWGNTLLGVAYTQPLGARWGGDSTRVMQRLSWTGFNTTLDLGDGSLRFVNTLGDSRAWGELSRWRGTHETLVGYEWSGLRTRYDINAAASDDPILAVGQRPSAASVYVDHTVRGARTVTRVGMRGETVTGTGWTGLSPRLSFKWFATPNRAFTVAAGRTTQWTPALRNEQAPIRIFDFWLTADRNTPVASAWQGSAGGEQWFGGSRFVRLEGWIKRYGSLPSSNLFNDPDVLGDEFIVTTGTSYGADVLVRQLERERVSGWIAYSYAVSWRDGVDGRFAPVQDRRHNLNVVTSYRPGGVWSYGIRLGVGTGTPFTDVVGQLVRRRYDPITNSFSTGNQDVSREPIGGVRNGARFPLFQRMDVSVTRTKPGKRTWAPYFSIVNAYNARNVFTYFFDYSDNPPTRTAISQFPFIPTAGVSVSW
ncbi:MAG: TonB-dependent receptor [Gemmatimonas sp.]|nr:TonB-dependent receptor [Gemmatimonas sp.]